MQRWKHPKNTPECEYGSRSDVLLSIKFRRGAEPFGLPLPLTPTLQSPSPVQNSNQVPLPYCLFVFFIQFSLEDATLRSSWDYSQDRNMLPQLPS